MQKKKIVVIGGSAAGAKAAARARRLDQHAEITIIQKSPDLSMASCGYPYYVGGTFAERSQLLATPTGVVRDSAFFQKIKMIKALTDTECIAIDRAGKRVGLPGPEKRRGVLACIRQARSGPGCTRQFSAGAGARP
jgi:NADPH-dependent 2,4-dienoyl-CoA reductase/sulfur reductase-like enzyme